MDHRDLVVIGGSSGGLEALGRFVPALPADLPATVLVALHVGAGPSALAEVLDTERGLPVRFARDGDPLRHGELLVAPPGRHLLVEERGVRLSSGPRENGFRPAIDPLFRSAARTAGPRVIGVVLSGALDDGAAGLREIKRNGGLAIAQSPEDAIIPHLPRAAAAQADPDHVVSADAMAPLITRLTRGVIEPSGRHPSEKTADEATDLTCPDCGGVLRKSGGPLEARFACHVGHVYSPDSLAASHGEATERALWSSHRMLREAAILRRGLAERSRAGGLDGLAKAYEAHADEADRNAEAILSVIDRATRPTG